MSANPYPIESFEPIPRKYFIRARYPWYRLNVGQSFLVPLAEFSQMRTLWNTMSSCKRNAQRKSGYKFVLREIRQNGVIGIRVWRVK